MSLGVQVLQQTVSSYSGAAFPEAGERDSTLRTTNWIQMDDFVKGPHGEVQVMRSVLMTEGLGGLYRGPFWEGF